MFNRRRIRPIIISLIIMVLLALAWLPTGDLLPEQRSNKPFLFISYSTPVPNNNALQDVLFDVQQRLEQRHEWKLIDEPADYAWQLTVSVSQPDNLELLGELTGPNADLQRFKIQGRPEAMGALPEQYVKVLIDLVEAGDNAQ
ncbi:MULTISPECIES: hypothetical protein [Idiomarinaceae]|uniref:Uncharacterized protein n=1 Tax=Pseudidiomarina sp. PP-1MA TaxID=3237706 RepID=A0AB39X7V6_9GAMM|nr:MULTISPECIES: hypothetical protein [Idiomarina]MDX1526510.1 hypothetical protein [Pseudidiomarina maritima]MRJ42379.1 hypothetical protein [Idiomarina sp. FeN1]NCU57993.1 hypothetical protein [Idiomarina sp. FenA--70]NCU60691.1 hypothetical protein [Idiomarina sp. FenBw--71]UUN14042.1 hypothetical protein KGF88_02095 [Idiomarina loihiensis]